MSKLDTQLKKNPRRIASKQVIKRSMAAQLSLAETTNKRANSQLFATEITWKHFQHCDHSVGKHWPHVAHTSMPPNSNEKNQQSRPMWISARGNFIKKEKQPLNKAAFNRAKHVEINSANYFWWRKLYTKIVWPDWKVNMGPAALKCHMKSDPTSKIIAKQTGQTLTRWCENSFYFF